MGNAEEQKDPPQHPGPVITGVVLTQSMGPGPAELSLFSALSSLSSLRVCSKKTPPPWFLLDHTCTISKIATRCYYLREPRDLWGPARQPPSTWAAPT